MRPTVMIAKPVGYETSIGLQLDAKAVFTDSGGVQEEASYLGVPCITLRPNTTRPITVELGTSTLLCNDPAKIVSTYERVRDGCYKQAQPIPLWDGRAAGRIVQVLLEWFNTVGAV